MKMASRADLFCAIPSSYSLLFQFLLSPKNYGSFSYHVVESGQKRSLLNGKCWECYVHRR